MKHRPMTAKRESESARIKLAGYDRRRTRGPGKRRDSHGGAPDEARLIADLKMGEWSKFDALLSKYDL